MSRALAFVGLVLCLAALVGVALIPFDPKDAEAKWGMAAIFGGVAALSAYSLFGTKRSEYLGLRKTVEPLREDVCPYCGEETVRGSRARCEHCQITIQRID